VLESSLKKKTPPKAENGKKTEDKPSPAKHVTFKEDNETKQKPASKRPTSAKRPVTDGQKHQMSEESETSSPNSGKTPDSKEDSSKLESGTEYNLTLTQTLLQLEKEIRFHYNEGSQQDRDTKLTKYC